MSEIQILNEKIRELEYRLNTLIVWLTQIIGEQGVKQLQALKPPEVKDD